MSLLAKRIRSRRKTLQLNQESLAELIGTNQGQVSKYENGDNVPSSEVLAALAQALETSADWLLGLSQEIQPDLNETDLSPKEQEAVSAWRRGDRLDAIKTIVMDE